MSRLDDYGYFIAFMMCYEIVLDYRVYQRGNILSVLQLDDFVRFEHDFLLRSSTNYV